MKGRYIIITPIRDEIRTIRLVLESVTKQTELPVQWLILDDGSTDGTQEVLNEYSQRFDWIWVIPKKYRSERKVGENIVHILHEGLAEAQGLAWDFWAKLDGDISFQPDHYEKLLNEFESDPKLGMASGVSFLPASEGEQPLEWTPPHQPLGMNRMYRRTCWEDIVHLAPRRHWDAIDVYTAQMHGWVTRSFSHIPVVHHRAIDAAQKNPLARRFDSGFHYYTAGYHPIYFLARSIRAMWDEKPYLVSGIAMYTGYLSALITRQNFYDQSLKKYIYSRQWEMVKPGNFLNYVKTKRKAGSNSG